MTQAKNQVSAFSFTGKISFSLTRLILLEKNAVKLRICDKELASLKQQDDLLKTQMSAAPTHTIVPIPFSIKQTLTESSEKRLWSHDGTGFVTGVGVEVCFTDERYEGYADWWRGFHRFQIFNQMHKARKPDTQAHTHTHTHTHREREREREGEEDTHTKIEKKDIHANR
jgi:hypothetical protein